MATPWPGLRIIAIASAFINIFFISRDLKKSVCPHADQLLPKLPVPNTFHVEQAYFR